MILSYKTDFFPIYSAPLRTCKSYQNLWIYLTLESSRCKNSGANFRTLRLVQKTLLRLKNAPKLSVPLLFCRFFNLPYELWGVITFERVISLCWNFPDNLLWKMFIKIWDGSCHNLWNFGPFDMEWPIIKVQRRCDSGACNTMNGLTLQSTIWSCHKN